MRKTSSLSESAWTGSARAGPGISWLWVALGFLSLSWLFFVPVVARTNSWVGFELLAGGVILSILVMRETPPAAVAKVNAVLLPPLIASAVLIPFPYNLGPALLALGIAVACAHPRLSSAGLGILIPGMVFAVQSALMPLLNGLVARYHRSGALAALADLILRTLGVKAARVDSTVVIRGARESLSIAVTWEQVGLLLAVMVMAGGLLLIIFASSQRLRSALLFLGITAGYMVLRSVFLILMFAESGRVDAFWNAFLSSVTVFPLFFVLLKAVPLDTTPLPWITRLDRRTMTAVAAAFTCVFLVLGYWGLSDPGARKHGRVLIDEKHSRWERTTEKYDTKWYGKLSVYNYYSLYKYLSSYYRTRRNFREITPDTLRGCDILILKTPTERFSGDEVKAIADFVDGGGGLFLVGDHTNVFGMSTFINPVAEQFGFRFRYDATYDLATGNLQDFYRSRTMPHPIVQRMPPFLFATSCTLEAPLSAQDVIVGNGLKSLDVDYSQKNFFPRDINSPEMLFGLFLQAAAVKHGRGRVVAFTDSTVFSNFWMFMPGKPELALGATEWLNRRNSSPDPSVILLLLGLAALLVTAIAVRRMRGPGAALILFSAVLLAVPVASRAYGALNGANFVVPRPRSKVTTVNFEQEHSDFALPVLVEGFNAGPRRKYETFYAWTQRLGWQPAVSPTLEAAMKGADVLVVIRPTRPLTRQERTDILAYVRRGGRLLLMDSGANKHSTSNDFLGAFGMKVDLRPVGKSKTGFAPGRSITTTSQACSVMGGEALLSAGEGRSVLSFSRKGRGVVAAFTDSDVFANDQLGEVGSLPSRRQVSLSELEFWMLKQTMNNFEPGGAG